MRRKAAYYKDCILSVLVMEMEEMSRFNYCIFDQKKVLVYVLRRIKKGISKAESALFRGLRDLS